MWRAAKSIGKSLFEKYVLVCRSDTAVFIRCLGIDYIVYPDTSVIVVGFYYDELVIIVISKIVVHSGRQLLHVYRLYKETIRIYLEGIKDYVRKTRKEYYSGIAVFLP